jgi:hypothetical protein
MQDKRFSGHEWREMMEFIYEQARDELKGVGTAASWLQVNKRGDGCTSRQPPGALLRGNFTVDMPHSELIENPRVSCMREMYIMLIAGSRLMLAPQSISRKLTWKTTQNRRKKTGKSADQSLLSCTTVVMESQVAHNGQREQTPIMYSTACASPRATGNSGCLFQVCKISLDLFRPLEE